MTEEVEIGPVPSEEKPRTQDIIDKSNPRKAKYWIDQGVEVAHRDFPFRKMIADKVVREPITKHVSGVDCHWLDVEGRYGTGRFMTTELIPYDHKHDEIWKGVMQEWMDEKSNLLYGK